MENDGEAAGGLSGGRRGLNLLARIVVNPAIFGGKPIVRGRRLAVEHDVAPVHKHPVDIS